MRNRLWRLIMLLLPRVQQSTSLEDILNHVHQDRNLESSSNDLYTHPIYPSHVAPRVDFEAPRQADQWFTTQPILASEPNPHIDQPAGTSAPPNDFPFVQLPSRVGYHDSDRTREETMFYSPQDEHSPSPLHFIQSNQLPTQGYYESHMATRFHNPYSMDQGEWGSLSFHSVGPSGFQPAQHPPNSPFLDNNVGMMQDHYTYAATGYHIPNIHEQLGYGSSYLQDPSHFRSPQDPSTLPFNSDYAGSVHGYSSHDANNDYIDHDHQHQPTPPNFQYSSGGINAFISHDAISNLQSLSSQIENCKYHIANFETSTTDLKMVIEAVNRLRLADGNNFMNILMSRCSAQHSLTEIRANFPHPLLTLDSSSGESARPFFDFFRTWNDKPPLGANQIGDKKGQGAWDELFFPEQKIPSSTQETFSMFKQEVSSRFENSIDSLRKEISLMPPVGQRSPTSELTGVKKIFPVYLFYVNLICTIIPAQHLNNPGETLESQQTIAVEDFFRLMRTAILSKKQRKVSEKKTGLKIIVHKTKELVRIKYFLAYSEGVELIWKALQYWILSSRNDLITGDTEEHPHENFRLFFDSLVWDWAKCPN